MSDSYVKRAAGFTLVEVMVATVIVGVSFTAICGLISQTTRTASITDRTARAVMLVQSKLDELLATGMKETQGVFPVSPGYKWEVKLKAGEQSGLQEVEVIVKFNAPGGEREVILNSLMADRKVSGGQSKE